MTQALSTQHLPPEAIHQLLDYLPEYVKESLLAKADNLDCSLEAVIELAIASFLNEEAFSFEDCLLAERLKGLSNQGSR
jgi:hypothetical protein